MAEGGALEGFADVVAAAAPLEDDQSPHWSVTFAVDDADAVAAKAEQLGGKVLVAPFDAPWVRMTILSDPAGATFIASKFVPENRDLAATANSAAA
jgi:predicted enzyme related to lactoylglutathione lyase